MQKPIEVPVHFRWKKKKKIKNLVETTEGSRYRWTIRIGIEFSDLDDEMASQFKKIIRKLSVADAI